MTLTPAYGRDYTSKKAVLVDWNADKDFIIADIMDRWCGKPINKSQCSKGSTINIRYKKNTQVCVVKA